MRVLELYSGIGGMHYALKESSISHQVVAAVDINTTANQVYQHNFPNTPVMNKTIEGLSLEDFNKLSFDMVLMSPPCQPFTRIGLQRDLADPRTKSFLHVIDLLPRLNKAPVFILLENVKGFEKSAAREHLVKTLVECGYAVQEMLVSPTHFGIPNSRLRYYLLAKVSGHKREAQMGQEAAFSMSSLHLSPQIQDFLEAQEEVNVEQHLLPPKTLLRYAQLLDIVRPTCRRSVCFTKGYGKYVEGTGSVLQCCSDTSVERVFLSLEQCSEEEKVQRLLQLKLRYFTPREVSNLMGFPLTFCKPDEEAGAFPESVSIKQQYRLLGNSLNVEVVAKLLQLLVLQ